jgi:predicted Zn-dependent peptidase
MSNAFKDRNYSKIPQGTPESLSRLTLEDAKNYYKNMLGKKSCFLVIVGNITEADLKAKINSSLAKLPEGKTAVKEKRVAITNPQIVIENRDIATNYLNGVLLAPLATDRESVAMKVAMEILNDRFFIELRTNRSLSYAPKAYHRGNMVTDPFNVLYITTLDPKTSMKVMVDEVDKVRKSGFSEKELKDMKQTFLTYYFLNLETNDAQTLALGTLELAGDYKLFEKLTSEVNQLTLTELNKAFRKYSDKISWTYLGKKDAVKMDDFPQPGILGDNSLEVKK